MGLLDRVMLKKARFENEETPPELLPPKEAEEPEAADMTDAGSWLIFADGSNAQPLTALLEAEGDKVVTVKAGKGYAAAGTAITINPSKPEDYAALLADVRSVGVMGDERTYGNPVVIRAVTSDDAMTADWARIPYETLEVMSQRIINEVPGINRVTYDITSKPPGTIEWE